LQKLNSDLAGLNSALAGRSATTGAPAFSGGTLATMPAAEADKKQVTQLVIPADPRTRAAMDAAMPNIKKVLGIHQCIRENQALSQLNFYAVPGVDMAEYRGYRAFPNSNEWMKYHDFSKCVSITTLDQWGMPALNALRFRAVYFAEDSGETTNFSYRFKKVDDGSWKLASLVQGDRSH